MQSSEGDNHVNMKLFSAAQDWYKIKHYNECINHWKAITKAVITTSPEYILLISKCYYNINDMNNLITHILPYIQSNISTKKEKESITLYHLLCEAYINMFDIKLAYEYYSKWTLISGKLKGKEYKVGLMGLKSKLDGKAKEIEDNNKKFPKAYSKYIAMMRHLYNNGAYINKLDIKFNTASQRYVQSTAKIKKNEVLLKIPLKCLINWNDVAETAWCKFITEENRRKLWSPNHSILTIFLLNELDKGSASEWTFYLDMLPEDYSNFPWFYTCEELDLLSGTWFHKTLLNKKLEVERDYKVLCDIIPDFHKFPFWNFWKMRMVVCSRIFGVIVKNKKSDILAPFADMLNHKRPRQTHWYYDNRQDSFIFTALEEWSSDCEIFDSYGKKCNSRFLLHYGFCIENNEDNEYKINVSLTKDYPLFLEKLLWLKYCTNKQFLLKKDYDDATCYFFSFVRFLLHKGPIYDILLSEFGKQDFKVSPISWENEIEVCNTINEMVCELLMKYPKTWKEDIDYYEQNKWKLTFNERNIYIMRISEMVILDFYRKVTMKSLEIFKGKYSEELLKQSVGKGTLINPNESYSDSDERERESGNNNDNNYYCSIINKKWGRNYHDHCYFSEIEEYVNKVYSFVFNDVWTESYV